MGTARYAGGMPIDQQVLTNTKAERIRRISELTNRKHLQKAGKFLIEVPQCVREALTWQPQIIQDVYVRTDGADPDSPIASTALGKLAGEAMEERIHVHKMTQEVEHRVSHDAQGVFAVADLNSCRDLLGRVPQTPHPFLAAFWQMRDPGNAGTVIRSADAAGCDAVVLVGDCVDIFNPKVIRATTGSLFHLPVLAMDERAFFDLCRERDTTVLAADVYGTEGKPPVSLPDLLRNRELVEGSKAVLFGNEARGLTTELLDECAMSVSIPIYGKAESLNLGTSAAVMLTTLAMSSRIETMGSR